MTNKIPKSKRISTKIAYNEYEYINEKVKCGDYLNHSDFFRDAIRSKLKSKPINSKRIEKGVRLLLSKEIQANIYLLHQIQNSNNNVPKKKADYLFEGNVKMWYAFLHDIPEFFEEDELYMLYLFYEGLETIIKEKYLEEGILSNSDLIKKTESDGEKVLRKVFNINTFTL